MSIEAISKLQIVFQGKASRSNNGTTQPWGAKWGFETTANKFLRLLQAALSAHQKST
jgi:hypothetical protein